MESSVVPACNHYYEACSIKFEAFRLVLIAFSLDCSKHFYLPKKNTKTKLLEAICYSAVKNSKTLSCETIRFGTFFFRRVRLLIKFTEKHYSDGSVATKMRVACCKSRLALCNFAHRFKPTLLNHWISRNEFHDFIFCSSATGAGEKRARLANQFSLNRAVRLTFSRNINK